MSVLCNNIKVQFKIIFLYFFSTVLIIFISIKGYSQNEANNWYFGDSTGINFNYGNPKIIKSSKLISFGSPASYSSSDGKLIFYGGNDTKKNIFYDSSGNVMSGTSFINGSTDDSIQSYKLVIKKPDTSSQYLIFTSFGYSSKNPSLKFSELDMKLNNGKGSFIKSKSNKTLLSLNLSKSQSLWIATALHHNTKDAWLIVPIVESDSIYCYKISAKGIDTIPQISITGTKIFSFPTPVIKVSPNNKKVALVENSTSVLLADFDDSLGIISNFKRITSVYTFSLEFSPNSKFLYLNHNPRTISQYDITQKTASLIVNSRKTIDSGYSKNIYSLQLAPNMKIYIGSEWDSLVHVINQPDSFGKSSRPEKKILNLKRKYSGYFPLYPSYLFESKNFTVSRNCLNDTCFFNIEDFSHIDSVKWDFGDTSSGINNYSNQIFKPVHIYNTKGIYKVKLIWYFKQNIKTSIMNVKINDVKPYLGNDTVYCNSFNRMLYPKRNYTSYLWSTGNKSPSIFINGNGDFWLKALDSSGCWSSDTITIINPRIIPNFSINDSNQCYKGNNFVMINNSIFIDDSYKKSNWIFSDSSISIDSITNKSFFHPGTFSVKLITESKNTCRDSIEKKVKVFNQTKLDFNINNASQCLNVNKFDFTNLSINSDSVSYNWNLGDRFVSTKDIVGEKYKKSGVFEITLFSYSEFGCLDTLSKQITILQSPEADFKYGEACNNSVIYFNFTGRIPPLPVTSKFKWIFPDDTSNLVYPNVYLKNVGINNVKLFINSDNGCSDYVSKDVLVKYQAIADFIAENVCENMPVIFKNKTKIINDTLNYLWLFGDGNTEKTTDPLHFYNIDKITRTFLVKLIAIVNNGCKDSITKSVTVNSTPRASFNYSITNLTVNFTAIETDAMNYYWNFGDSNFVFSDKSFQTHIYSKYPKEKYKVCLTTTNLADCKNDTCIDIFLNVSQSHIIQKATAIYPNPNNGNFIIEIHPSIHNSEIEIFNLNGKLVFEKKSIENTILELNLAKGFYMIRVRIGSQVSNHKLFVN